MQSGDSWRIATPTAAQLRVGKLLVDKIADQIFHRETKTINAEVSEIHAALCYANTQICGEAHSTFFQVVGTTNKAPSLLDLQTKPPPYQIQLYSWVHDAGLRTHDRTVWLHAHAYYS